MKCPYENIKCPFGLKEPDMNICQRCWILPSDSLRPKETIKDE